MSKLVLLLTLLAGFYLIGIQARTEPEDLAALRAFRDSFEVFKPSWPLETIDPCDNLPLYKFTITCLPPTQPHFPWRVGKISLDCYGLKGSLPAVLKNFTALRIIDLANNYLSGEVNETFFPPRLQYINLFNNSFTGSVPTFSHLTNLQELYLAKNRLSGTVPGNYGQNNTLRVLSLNSNLLTGTIPASLGSYSSLTQLFLANNSLTGTLPPSLGNLTNLLILSVWRNKLSGAIPTEFGALSKLRFLYLDRNAFTGEIPSQLSALGDLRILYLRENKLEGQIPSELGLLPSLAALSLAVNNFTGSIPNELANIPNITVLHIYLNRHLGGTLPNSLGFTSMLADLDLSSNKISGTIPSEWSTLLTRPSFHRLKLAWNDLTGNLTNSIFSEKPTTPSVDLSQNTWTCNSLPDWCSEKGDNTCSTVRCIVPSTTTSAPSTNSSSNTDVLTKRSTRDVESVTLNWVSSVNEEENGGSVDYEAQMAEEDSDNYSSVYRGKEATATIYGLSKGKRYQFRIRAIHDGVVGPWSDAIKAMVK